MCPAMHPLHGGDTQPWYRQFWPWFLILLPASVVVAGLSTVYIANRHADDLVVDEYYREGLAINRQLEKKRRAEELQLSVSIRFGTESVVAEIHGPVADPSLRLSLSHPLESDQDFSVFLSRLAPGLYRGPLQREVSPRWHWTLESMRADPWRLDGAVHAAEIDRASRR
jgi:hypothetical protein